MLFFYQHTDFLLFYSIKLLTLFTVFLSKYRLYFVYSFKMSTVLCVFYQNNDFVLFFSIKLETFFSFFLAKYQLYFFIHSKYPLYCVYSLKISAFFLLSKYRLLWGFSNTILVFFQNIDFDFLSEGPKCKKKLLCRYYVKWEIGNMKSLDWHSKLD